MIRVALVDDQAMVRAGLARILSPADGFDVVAECGDGEEAVDELQRVDADVILMDVRMPRLDGLAATAQLCSVADPVPVLILTTFGEDDVLWGAIEAGASGFVPQDRSPEGPVPAARAGARRGARVPPPRRRAAPRDHPPAAAAQ